MPQTGEDALPGIQIGGLAEGAAYEAAQLHEALGRALGIHPGRYERTQVPASFEGMDEEAEAVLEVRQGRVAAVPEIH